MSIKSDGWIIQQCSGENPMVTPFQANQVRVVDDETRHVARKVISYGVSSYGLDLRLAEDGFRVFSPIVGAEIDPKNFDENTLIGAPLRTGADGSRYWLMPPHSYALGVTVETFNIPRNVLALCVGKSTYARSGIIVNTTPLEPGWRGRLVLEFSNSADLPVRIYANEGIAQVTFFEGDEACAISYADRAGKYQDQSGITHARV